VPGHPDLYPTFTYPVGTAAYNPAPPVSSQQNYPVGFTIPNAPSASQIPDDPPPYDAPPAYGFTAEVDKSANSYWNNLSDIITCYQVIFCIFTLFLDFNILKHFSFNSPNREHVDEKVFHNKTREWGEIKLVTLLK